MRCNLGLMTAGCALIPATYLALVVPVHAQDTTSPAYQVSTRVDPCVPIDVVRFKRLLSIELGSAKDPSAHTREAPHAATVSLTCVADGIQLALEDAVTRKSVT